MMAAHHVPYICIIKQGVQMHFVSSNNSYLWYSEANKETEAATVPDLLYCISVCKT
jgi:hypothetical protein